MHHHVTSIVVVLSHHMADGTDTPVALASRTLAPAEKNHAQIVRKGLVIVFGVTKFHKYVYGRLCHTNRSQITYWFSQGGQADIATCKS